MVFLLHYCPVKIGHRQKYDKYWLETAKNLKESDIAHEIK